MTILDVLRHMGDNVEEAVPDLNYGGCCVYAAAVARALQNAGYEVWGIVDGRCWDNTLTEVRNSLPLSWTGTRDWIRAGASFHHVLIQFKADGIIYTHDSRRTHVANNYEISYCIGRLTVRELERLSADQSGWNQMFEWNYRRPIRRMVTRYVKAYRVAKAKARTA